ncbi:SDR family NAD(P)-dependent oxidoreductase, partial [Rhodococcus sp. YH1]
MTERRVALVTGASRSVGKGIACALGSDGWTVYVTARGPVGTDSPLDRTAATVTERGGLGIAVQCDHTDDEQIRALFRRIADEQGGRLDLLVNNVWASPPGFAGFSEPFWKRPISDWDSLVGVGLRAHYVASVDAAQLMVPRGSGMIVNISSFGTRGYLHSVLYGISKAGLDKMAADMAVDLAGTGVTALSLWPGLVKNEAMLARGID